jgi:hypothetical protein
MFDITIITGLASLLGCLCMALVCAAQIAELFAAARPSPPSEQPWEMNIRAWPARGSWNSSAYVPGFARLDGQLAPSTP